MPAKMDEIIAIAQEYEIPILEDAAEAIGSEYKGKKCGTLGGYGALSFNGNKMITTSGGGALICPSREAADRVTFYATQAREQAPHYQHEKIGYNYRLSNICAGIGRGQMQVLDEHIARRRTIHSLYSQGLGSISGIEVQQNPSTQFNSNFWLTTILIDPKQTGFDREQLRLRLEEGNIESRPLWKPMHLQPVFASCPYYGGSVSEELFERGLCLPSGSALSDDDIAHVIEVIKSFTRYNTPLPNQGSYSGENPSPACGSFRLPRGKRQCTSPHRRNWSRAKCFAKQIAQKRLYTTLLLPLYPRKPP